MFQSYWYNFILYIQYTYVTNRTNTEGIFVNYFSKKTLNISSLLSNKLHVGSTNIDNALKLDNGSFNRRVIFFINFQRTSSSSSRSSSVDKIAIKNLLQSRLLITQASGLDDDDIDLDLIDFGDGRMSRDTDYETDLEMDYDG